MQATGTITIPTAGNWTFCANTDDGFSATINGNTFDYDGLRGSVDSLYTINFASAGTYPVTFMQFQNAGGSNAEFSAAAGTKTAFDSTFRLVGDTADGGLKVVSTPFNGGTSNSGAFAAAVATNVKPAVEAAIATAGATSLYTRITFNAANYASLSSLTLKMQYDDGYVAYLNGVEVASENAPTSPAWNSWATEEQTSDVQATTYENVDLSRFLNSATNGHLTATGNVLAIQVLLSSATDGDMLVVPELAQMTERRRRRPHFHHAHAGAANVLSGVQSDVTFSMPDGLYYAPIQTTLAPDVPGTLVRYTTDDSIPTAAVAGVAESISSITYGGTNNLTATVTCANHGFYTGDQVEIAGAAQAQYDGVFTITVLGANTFTYTMSSSPGANATGTMTAALIPAGTDNSQAITSLTSSGATATATYSGNTFLAGQQIQITGATPAQYDGVFTVASVPSSTTFTYTMSAAPGVAASGLCMTASPLEQVKSIVYGGSGGLTATASISGAIASITYSGTTAAVTMGAAENFVSGQQIQIAGAAPRNTTAPSTLP